MIKRFKDIFFLVFFLVFIFFITNQYFSEENVIFTNKSRTFFHTKLDNHKNNLPVLENDTNNIINYVDGLQKFEKSRKKRIWEKLISDE